MSKVDEKQLAVPIIEKTDPALLSKEEIEGLLPHLDDIIKWAKQIQDFALQQALAGENYEGYKVVAGRANRSFKDTDQVVDALLADGYDEAVIYERKLKTLTQIESLVGKKNFTNLLGDLVFVPEGKPTLVPADDKRPAIDRVSQAAADFADGLVDL